MERILNISIYLRRTYLLMGQAWLTTEHHAQPSSHQCWVRQFGKDSKFVEKMNCIPEHPMLLSGTCESATQDEKCHRARESIDRLGCDRG
jgi:hypothetical protein